MPVDLGNATQMLAQLDYPTLLGGTNWRLVAVTKYIDGDTLRILRDRYVTADSPEISISDDLLLQSSVVTYVRDNPGSDPTDPMAGRSARLVYVDTPERGDTANWARANADTKAWIEERAGNLMVTTYGTSGGFDRLLADIWVAGDRNNTLSKYLIIERGWPPYVKGV